MLDLPWPPTSDQLATFPRRNLPKHRVIHRLHHRDLNPFWFGSTPAASENGNRFDLAPPRGSSYWALNRAVAVLETLFRRPVQVLPLELVDRYSLTSAPLPRALGDLANLPVKAARRFGLTAEIHTTTNRRLTRAWAAALDEAGLQGIIGLARHDVTGRQRTLTLFGESGEHAPFGWKWKPHTSALPAEVHDELAAWGVRVLPIPFEVDTINWEP